MAADDDLRGLLICCWGYTGIDIRTHIHTGAAQEANAFHIEMCEASLIIAVEPLRVPSCLLIS